MTNALYGFNFASINIFYPSLKNPEFHWDDQEAAKFLTLLTASLNLGMLFASFGSYCLKSYSPHTVLKVTKTVFAISCLLSLISNVYVLIAMRFVQGLGIGVSTTTAPTGLYQMGASKHRSRLPTLLNVAFGVTYFITYFFGVLDNSTRVYWRLFYIFQFGIVALELIVMFTVLKDTDTIAYTLKTKGKDKAVELLATILSKREAEESVNQLLHMHEMESQKKISLHHVYSKELGFALTIGFLLILTFFMGFMPVSLLWITKDINNVEEVQTAKKIALFYTVMEFFSRAACSLFEFHRYRKRYFMAGILLVGIAWGMISFAYYIDVTYIPNQ